MKILAINSSLKAMLRFFVSLRLQKRVPYTRCGLTLCCVELRNKAIYREKQQRHEKLIQNTKQFFRDFNSGFTLVLRIFVGCGLNFVSVRG